MPECTRSGDSPYDPHILKDAHAQPGSPRKTACSVSRCAQHSVAKTHLIGQDGPQSRVLSYRRGIGGTIIADSGTVFQPSHNVLPVRAGLHSAHHTTEPIMKNPVSLPLAGANGVRIEILERSDTTLVIRWVEPGRCH